MTPERLAQIKAHVLNPPSASLNRDWVLELVEALERLLSFAPVAVALDAAPAVPVIDDPPPFIEDPSPAVEAPKPKKGKK